MTHEIGHGREETRSYYHLPVPKNVPGGADWKGLKSIDLVVSEVVRDSK